jgi:1,4-dihydroxy-2-naphthoate polyprenyltransferase
VAPQRVLVATWVAFAVAIGCGTYLTAVAGPLILVVGVLSIAAGVLYTGGPRPYGYEGLGELFVFMFFGLVAVNGSYYVQLERLDGLPFGLSLSVGLLVSSILVVNNIRDIETDARVGKRTLAVRLGRERTRTLYRAMLGGAFLALPVTLLIWDGPAAALLGLLVAPMALRLDKVVRTRTDGPALNGALAGTGALVGAFSLLVSIGLLLAS